jgi:hypothetical protein
MPLPIREILDADDLYRRIAANHIRRDGTLSPTAFMKSSESKGHSRCATGWLSSRTSAC